MDTDSLVVRIRTAFASNVYPGDDHLTEYNPAGRNYDESYKILRGKPWWEFSIAKFMSGDTPIPDLTAESFHYYLPGLLIGSLENDPLAVTIAESLMYFLSPVSASSTGEFAYDDMARFVRKIQLLTTEQREVIVRVLNEYVARGWTTTAKIQDTIDFLTMK